MSKLQVDEIVNKEDNGSVTLPRGAIVTGVATSTVLMEQATRIIGDYSRRKCITCT